METQKGEWTYDRSDNVLELSGSLDVNILPILIAEPAWASPAYQHLDDWRSYVQNVVGRYKNKLRYWEIWNEQNGPHTWYGEPNAAQYARLLEAAYEEIKKIDKDLVVVIGGHSGIPTEYIEALYAAGAGSFFDVMNVHPYQIDPESYQFREQLDELKNLMGQHGDDGKPIWITEYGISTQNSVPKVSELLSGVVSGGLAAIDSQREDWSPLLLDDPNYLGGFGYKAEAIAMNMFKPMSPEKIKLEDLKALEPSKNGLIVLPPTETFPINYFDDIERYVQRGGVLMFWDGVPLYYDATKYSRDNPLNSIVSTSYRERLHVGWEAYWTKDGVPTSSTSNSPGRSWTADIDFPEKTPKASRFLNSGAIKDNDEFLPIIYSSNDSYQGVSAAVYKFDSELKGGLIVLSFIGVTWGETEERQAQRLPRKYLSTLQAGISLMFWYEFLAHEWDPFHNEDHFGIVGREHNHKPAFTAMATLTQARPPGSSVVEEFWRSDSGDLYHPQWKRPDGNLAWAIWKPEGEQTYSIRVKGDIHDTFDYLGNQIPISMNNGEATLVFSESIVYIIGPEEIEFTKTIGVNPPENLRITGN
ncbi:Beta-xylosidase [Thiorhodovibrio litoralis]|nr:Beta-xylosidase [Thiorhodovibrio litoralis]